MMRGAEYLLIAALAAPLTLAGCAEVSSVASTVSADAPQVASALTTICSTLVPAAEATVNALAKGGAAATIQADEATYVTPACAAAKTAAAVIDTGSLANAVAAMVSSAAASQKMTTPSATGGGH